MKLIYGEADVKKLKIRRIIDLSAGLAVSVAFFVVGVFFAVRRWEVGRSSAYFFSALSGGVALSLLVGTIIFYLHHTKFLSFVTQSLAPSKKISGTITDVYNKPANKDGLMFIVALISCDDGIDRYLYLPEGATVPEKGAKKIYYVIHNNFVCGTESEAENE